ncbi:hypothetical protein P154DRAFT_580566 [Amniculicola lignicola CBS 123094]|uniref:AB hydrolase-1 domain-containing protein n=1 Tax=Amniculicola lignicola CBS 123094 TaxID=1392246 RepID=A0A6A5W6H6_9PLEO|nr:hypothetical protein P154DRAFT_580566 [Amniculicola lignicola CBS 123094]
MARDANAVLLSVRQSVPIMTSFPPFHRPRYAASASNARGKTKSGPVPIPTPKTTISTPPLKGTHAKPSKLVGLSNPLPFLSQATRAVNLQKSTKPFDDERFHQTMKLADGRTIGYAEYGPKDGLPTLLHHGTPGSRLSSSMTKTAYDMNLRLICPERPGYGLSDPQ